MPKELGGLARPLPVSGALDGQLAGDLTIRDVTRPVTFDFRGMLEGNSFQGTGLTSIKITDFGVALPRVPAVASIEDLARLEVNVVAHAR